MSIESQINFESNSFTVSQQEGYISRPGTEIVEVEHQPILDATEIRAQLSVIHGEAASADESEGTAPQLSIASEAASADFKALATDTIVGNTLGLVKKPAKKAGFATRIKDAWHEYKEMPKFTHREATARDIERIVDVDMRAFDSVYKDYDQDQDELKSELIGKFAGRLEKTGGKWLPVLIREGEIVGFMSSCPTNKTPEDFTSWEDTTDQGTLETTYDPNGKNVYVVSLSMIPEGSRDEGQNMLFAQQISSFLKGGYERAFFESRLPGLRVWVQAECRRNGINVNELDAEQKQAYAEQYLNLKTTVNGKEVRKDRLNRIYDATGCTTGKVVADAYKDYPSMDFGVVRIFENPLPKSLQKNVIARNVAGMAVSAISRSPWLMKKVF